MAEPKKTNRPTRETSPVSRHLRGEDRDKPRTKDIQRLERELSKPSAKGVITDVNRFTALMKKMHGQNAKRVVEMYKTWREHAESENLTPEQIRAYEADLVKLMKSVRDTQKSYRKTEDSIEDASEALDEAREAYARIKDSYESGDVMEDITWDDVEEAELAVIKATDRLRALERKALERAKADEAAATAAEAELADFADEAAAAEHIEKKPAPDTATSGAAALAEKSTENFAGTIAEYIPNDKAVESALSRAISTLDDVYDVVGQVARVYKGGTAASIQALGSFLSEPKRAFDQAMAANDTQEAKTADWRDVLKRLNPMTPKQTKAVLKDAQAYVSAQRSITRSRIEFLGSIITSGRGHKELAKAVNLLDDTLEHVEDIGKRHAKDYPMLDTALKAYVEAGRRDVALYKKVLGT